MPPTQTAERPIRVAQRDFRPSPRPRVSTTALLIGYLIALGIVAALAGLLGNYVRSL